MIQIEDSNSETYYINPCNVIYVKKRSVKPYWKILLLNGEIIMTKNKDGAMAIVNKIIN
tara:strand:- start:4521 stop:4697 length:177 start_codon:yes stop_codon:yes gene_type:complete